VRAPILDLLGVLPPDDAFRDVDPGQRRRRTHDAVRRVFLAASLAQPLCLIIEDLTSGQTREFASPLPRRLVRTPAVSPDGRWIMFQVYRDGAWLLDVQRGVMQRVLEDPSAEEFAWSPDGRRVAYHSQRSGGWNLWTMAAP